RVPSTPVAPNRRPNMAEAPLPARDRPRQDPLDPARSFQGLILALQRYWADWGCVILQPYDMEVGAGTFHPAATLRARGPRPRALERRLRAALAPAQGRALRREPEPAAALLPVPGDPEAVARRHPGPLSQLAESDRHRSQDPRHPLCRGRLGEPDAWRL